jgi:putative transposase
MEHYRRTSHTRFDIKFHPVWITKYRKRLLRGDVDVRLRQVVRTTWRSRRSRSSRGA